MLHPQNLSMSLSLKEIFLFISIFSLSQISTIKKAFWFTLTLQSRSEWFGRNLLRPSSHFCMRHSQCSAYNLHHHLYKLSWLNRNVTTSAPYPILCPILCQRRLQSQPSPLFLSWLFTRLLYLYLQRRLILRYEKYYSAILVIKYSRMACRLWLLPSRHSEPYLSFSVLYIYYRFLNTVTLMAAVCV